MKTRSIPARRSMTVALGVGAALVVGVAFAVWTQTGVGSGSATATSAKNSTITVNAGTADLYPSFNGGDLYFKVDNPNPYPIRFTKLTPGDVTSPNATACPAGNVTVVGKEGLAIEVPANTTTAVSASIADVVTMSKDAPQGCQGLTFTIAATLDSTQY